MVERESAEPEPETFVNFAAGAGAQFLALELEKKSTDEHLETLLGALGADQGGLGLKKKQGVKRVGTKKWFLFTV